MAVTTSLIAYALKKVYSSREVQNAIYRDNPLFAMMSKAGGFTGESHIHAVRYRDTLGRSPTFATAQAGAQGSLGVTQGKQFVMTRVKEYQLYTLETEAILAGRDDRGSLIRTLTTEVDSALANMGRVMGQNVFRDGFGDKGQLTAIAGAGPYTWTVGEAITNFEVGMTVVVSTGSTKTSALRNSGTGVAITTIDRAAGTFTTATNGDSAAANDWIFEKGDRSAAGSLVQTDALKPAGLDAWVPATAPTSGDAFFSVDRSADSTRLAGNRKDISTMTPEEGLITALSLLARESGNPDYVFESFTDVKNIHQALGSKAVTEYQQVGDIGFSTIRVTGPKGDVRIVADINCPVSVGWLLTMSTWELKHLGDLMNILDLDGASLSREYNADRFEGRVAFYGNQVCYAPGKNMRLVLPS